MKKLTWIIITIGLFQILHVNAQNSEKKEQHHPVYLLYGLDTLKSKIGEIYKVDSSSFVPYKIVHFRFREMDAKHSWPYGSGYLIADDSKQDNKVIWFNLIYGDFGPHTFSWVDFDNDGDKDLFHLIGFEDVFGSQLFLNQMNSNKKIPFKPVYNNDLAYCALVDLNKDGIPEILNQIKKVEERYADYNPALNYKLEDRERKKIVEEYDRIIGDFDKCNFHYGMPNSYKVFSICIHADVNILAVVNDTLSDVSFKYPEHFCFRMEILKNIKNSGEMIKPWLSELEKKNKDRYNCKD